MTSDIRVLENLINRKVSHENCPKDKIYLLVDDLLCLIENSRGAKKSILDFLLELEKECKKTKDYEC